MVLCTSKTVKKLYEMYGSFCGSDGGVHVSAMLSGTLCPWLRISGLPGSKIGPETGYPE